MLFVLEQGGLLLVFIGDVDRLEKRSVRAYRRPLFGTFTNLWLFDKRCIQPDKTNASALALLPHDASHLSERLWALVQQTCPLPFSWRDARRMRRPHAAVG